MHFKSIAMLINLPKTLEFLKLAKKDIMLHAQICMTLQFEFKHVKASESHETRIWYTAEVHQWKMDVGTCNVVSAIGSCKLSFALFLFVWYNNLWGHDFYLLYPCDRLLGWSNTNNTRKYHRIGGGILKYLSTHQPTKLRIVKIGKVIIKLQTSWLHDVIKQVHSDEHVNSVGLVWRMDQLIQNLGEVSNVLNWSMLTERGQLCLVKSNNLRQTNSLCIESGRSQYTFVLLSN